MNEMLVKVDHSALRTNQAVIIGLCVLAFVLNLPALALLVGLVMLAGTLLKQPGFAFIYKYALKPLGLVKPDVLLDNAEPHRFAQGMGSAFLLAAAAALYGGLTVLGWALVWLVAALNLFAGFCAGCMIYYWLGRLKAPGFVKQPPPGVIPGMRPTQHKVGHDA